MSIAQNIQACHHCEHRERSCHQCRCYKDPEHREFVTLATAGGCPIGRHGDAAPAIIEQANAVARYGGMDARDAVTRALWKELHETAAGWTGTLAEWNVWLKEWLSRVPCGDCRQHAAEWIGSNPATLPPFPWTVAFHDSVNRRRGVSELGIVAATLLYPPTATAGTRECDRAASAPPASGD